MPKKSSRSTKRRPKRQSATQNILKTGFKQLTELSQAQEIRFRPEQPDVPRMRFSSRQMYNVELSYFNTITSSTTAAVSAGLTFQLSNMASSAGYTTVFDRYRLLQVNIKFIPTQTTATSGAPGTGGILYTVIDYDDANTPTNLTTMLSYGTLKICPPGQIEERTLTPRMAAAAYAGAFTSYANLSSKTWIDCNSPSVQYFGIKYYLTPTPTIQTITYVETLNFQFLSQRST